MSQNRTVIQVLRVVRSLAIRPKLPHSSSSGSGAECVSHVAVSWWCRDVAAEACAWRVLRAGGDMQTHLLEHRVKCSKKQIVQPASHIRSSEPRAAPEA